MAWCWSHCPEVYSGFRLALHHQPKKWLLAVAREWCYHEREHRPAPYRFPRTIAGSFRLFPGMSRLPKDILADWIADRAEELCTCDNGGFELYACPDGCHTISADDCVSAHSRFGEV